MGKFTLILVLFIVWVTVGFCALCPDQKSRCPSTSTCCKTDSGSYGCCPYVDATCCSDGSHCCPSHLTCDVAHSRCVPQQRIPYPFSSPMNTWNEIVEAELKQQTCPDGRQKCPDSYTCCAMTGGGYGCCPKEHGVCCADGTHCCPKGSKCHLARGSCDHSEV